MHLINKIARYVLIFFILALLGLGGVILWVRYQQTTIPPKTANKTNTTQLQETNPEFNTAISYQLAGNFTYAIPHFQAALRQESDPVLSAQIQMYLGTSYLNSGNYALAISVFKQLVSQSNGWPLMQAYAIQALANVHSYDLSNQQLTKLIFSGEPYSTLGPSATTTTEKAFRNLYAYAASIYPLGVSETRVAEWYTSHLAGILHGATTSPEGVQDLSVINDALAKTDTDVQRIEADPVAAGDLPEMLARKGLVDANLIKMGIDRSQDMQASFDTAKKYEISSGQPGGVVEIYNAIALLALYGDSTPPSQLKSILSVFIATGTPKLNYSLQYEFEAARAYSGQREFHNQLVSLGKLDADFKTYLISIGWKDSDFLQ